MKFTMEGRSFASVAFAFEQEVVDGLVCVCIAIGTVRGVRAIDAVKIFVQSDMTGSKLHDYRSLFPREVLD